MYINFTLSVFIFQDIKVRLKEICDEDIKEDHDCVVVFILSHGLKDIFFGTDGSHCNGRSKNYVEIQYVKDLLYGVKHLHGKPKMLFVQACQGSKL